MSDIDRWVERKLEDVEIGHAFRKRDEFEDARERALAELDQKFSDVAQALPHVPLLLELAHFKLRTDILKQFCAAGQQMDQNIAEILRKYGREA